MQGAQSPNCYFQRSGQTSAQAIEDVFDRAIESNKKFAYSNIRSVVCMMERNETQPLKALHRYLDDPQVVFVGVSNWVLDASTKKRCMVVALPPPTHTELKEFASGLPDPSVVAALELHVALTKSSLYGSKVGTRDCFAFLNHVIAHGSQAHIIGGLDDSPELQALLNRMWDQMSLLPLQRSRRTEIELIRSNLANSK